jgi:hypothetical protein
MHSKREPLTVKSAAELQPLRASMKKSGELKHHRETQGCTRTEELMFRYSLINVY